LIGTLENIAQRVAEDEFEAPAVAVFGEVVALRKDLNWYERRPLSGKRIVVTRRGTSGRAHESTRALGADVFELPTIRIEPPTDLREFAELVQDAHGYDWMCSPVRTASTPSSKYFTNCMMTRARLRHENRGHRSGNGPTGPRFHLHVDLQPDEFVASQSSVNSEARGRKFANPLGPGEKARDVLPRELSKLGAIVDEAFAYRTVPETRDVTGARRRLLEEGADLITFTSSSTVENFSRSVCLGQKECKSRVSDRSRRKRPLIMVSRSTSKRGVMTSKVWSKRLGNFL